MNEVFRCKVEGQSRIAKHASAIFLDLRVHSPQQQLEGLLLGERRNVVWSVGRVAKDVLVPVMHRRIGVVSVALRETGVWITGTWDGVDEYTIGTQLHQVIGPVDH